MAPESRGTNRRRGTKSFTLLNPAPSESPNPLANQIISCFQQSTFDPRSPDFLPEDSVKDLVTEAAIRKELKMDDLASTYPELDEEWQRNFIDWILRDAIKAFAITIQCDRKHDVTLKTMIRLFDCEFRDDDDLPLDDSRQTAGTTSLPEPWDFFFDSKFWNQLQLYNFYNIQWKCLAPVFAPGKYRYDESSQCIFPFVKNDSIPKEGAFSSVYRVRIHPAHETHGNLNDVAVKEIQVKGQDKLGTDKAWEQEARALEAINKLDHDHIVKCIAAIRRGDSRYFMFPWAGGDSLRDHWESAPKQSPKADTIRQAIIQLRGLADALDKLHHFDGGNAAHAMASSVGGLQPPEGLRMTVSSDVGEEYEDAAHKESIRHGDLKPENILNFAGEKTMLGMLKIADMGLAKRHVVATQDRSHLTSTRYGTIRYEAPETFTAIQGRSRLYDIWSMGCITLEYIIWILYGNADLENFYTQVKGNAQHVCQYFEVQENTTPRKAELHPVVRRWIEHIRSTDPECSQDSAIKDLLNVVQTRLLVIPLPPNRASSLKPSPLLQPPEDGETITHYRATASEFRDALDKILEKARAPGYLLIGKGRTGARPPVPRVSDTLSPISAKRLESHTGLIPSPLGQTSTDMSPRGLIDADYTLPPLEGWEFPVDNNFASKVTDAVGPQALGPPATVAAQLCERCNLLEFWSGGFAFEDKITDLEHRKMHCDFYRILLGICNTPSVPKGAKVRFERNQSTLRVAGGDPLPVLSIFRSPDLKTPLPIQLGIPELPNPGSEMFFDIVRLWLQDCDDDPSHKDCRGFPLTRLPTRLIDVGTKVTPSLRLLETLVEKVESTKYIALSHPWGDPKKHPPFSTLRSDDSGKGHTLQNFKAAIPYDQLPKTFKDAVDTTRALNVSYLWIDSLCIVQGKDGDFNEEANKMEDVFSGAYCVLAASRASNQHDGFLGPRPRSEYLTFQRGYEKPFYICAPIDNVSRDVLEGSLNRRGWVLQERALARRTIYFAETQTYFECGNGVRCETLARMHNNMAAFLGDPKFPDKAMRATSRALKISYFRNLYRQYSRLGFSFDEDRPIAIAGLERRLQKAFDTGGGYGIFDDGPDGGLFHRSLLWQRGEDEIEKETNLVPIIFPLERNIKVPTWSWMAYKGGIDYGDPPFQTAEWEKDEIRPPWTRGNIASAETTPHDPDMALTATVREFMVAGRKADEVKLVYDTDRAASDGQRPHCVIVAKSIVGEPKKDKRYYVLIVTPTGTTTARGEAVYKRAGSGYLPGKFITLDGAGTAGKII